MRKRYRFKLAAHTESLDVCTKHREVFDSSNGGKNIYTGLSNSVTDSRRHSSELERWLDERTAASDDARVARQALSGSIDALLAIAPSVSLDESAAKVLHTPRGESDEELLSVGREAADKLTPHIAEFAEAGLPGNVLTDLPKQIDALEGARARGQRARREYTLAGDALNESLKAGDRCVRTALVILRNTPTAPKDAEKDLRIAKRIGPRPKDDAAEASAPTTPSSPAAPSSATPAGTTKVA